MANIEAVIFDAGGVLHENNRAVSQDIMAELGIDEDVIAKIWSNEIPQLGSGKIDEAEFWKIVSEKYNLRPVDLSENLLGRAFAEKLTPIEGVSDLVRRLVKLGIRTAVLSDTIEPHAKALREANMYDGFDYRFLSHELGLRKPGPEIFKRALETLRVTPDATIFIDDDPKNVRGASELGIHGINFMDAKQLEDDLKSFIPNL